MKSMKKGKIIFFSFRDKNLMKMKILLYKIDFHEYFHHETVKYTYKKLKVKPIKIPNFLEMRYILFINKIDIKIAKSLKKNIDKGINVLNKVTNKYIDEENNLKPIEGIRKQLLIYDSILDRRSKSDKIIESNLLEVKDLYQILKKQRKYIGKISKERKD